MKIEEVDYLIERYKAEIEARLSTERHKAKIEFELYSVRRAEYCFEQIQPTELQAGRDILQISSKLQAAMIEKIISQEDTAARSSLYTLEAKLLSRKLPLTSDAVERLMKRAITSHMWYDYWMVTVKQVVHFVYAGGSITPSLEAGLREIHKEAKASLRYAFGKYTLQERQKLILEIDNLLENETSVKPDAGENWADQALSDLEMMTPHERVGWDMLFTHANTAEAAKPSAKWLAEAERHKGMT